MEKINVDVKGKMLSAYIEAHFDKGKKALESEGYRVISLEENAGLRMQEGKDSFVSRNGNWTREGVIYVPHKGIFLTKNSPIMDNAKEATDCHRNGRDYYLTDSQVEEALDDSVELKAGNIPTNRFKDNKITVYAFGNSVERYGQFLRNAGIKEMPVWLEDMQDKSFARQLWFRYLDGGSGLVGDGGLDGGGGVRGVRESAEGTTKNSEVYTVRDIQKVLKAKGLTGIEKILVDGLKQ